jgi:hypothetical protein
MLSYPDIQLAVLAGRGVNPHLRRWAERFQHVRVFRGSDLPDLLACRRNRILLWFRDQCRLPWLLLLDDDVVPVEQTDELLACAADVATARCMARTGREAHAHTASAACIKISRRALSAVPPPWFRFTLSTDGMRQLMCECQYFWRKFHRAGLTPATAGAVGHRFPVVVLPGPEFRFDEQVAAGCPLPAASHGKSGDE